MVCSSVLRITGGSSVETNLNHSFKTEHLCSLKFKAEGKVQASNLLGFWFWAAFKTRRGLFFQMQFDVAWDSINLTETSGKSFVDRKNISIVSWESTALQSQRIVLSKIIAILALKMWAVNPAEEQSNFKKIFAPQLCLVIFISKNIKNTCWAKLMMSSTQDCAI